MIMIELDSCNNGLVYGIHWNISQSFIHLTSSGHLRTALRHSLILPPHQPKLHPLVFRTTPISSFKPQTTSNQQCLPHLSATNHHLISIPNRSSTPSSANTSKPNQVPSYSSSSTSQTNTPSLSMVSTAKYL